MQAMNKERNQERNSIKLPKKPQLSTQQSFNKGGEKLVP